MKKNFLSLSVLCFVGSSLSSCSLQTTKKKEQQQPNIIFIMSDDHAYQAISAYGFGLNKTPNIDRIANEGVIFSRACCTNSICAPSRAVMLTGKHSFVNGKVDNHLSFNWEQENIAKLLQKNGYQTAVIGKIHLEGIPKGFDYSAVLPGQGDYYNPKFIFGKDTTVIEGYVTDITTNLALKWLENRNKNKPFLLLYHQKAPHREWLPAERHLKKYTQTTYPEPISLFDDYSGRGTAAHEAEMNILIHQNWAGDSKIRPDVMDKLGIKETWNWDKSAWKNNTERMNTKQRASWNAVYDSINTDFEKTYPQMSKKDLMKWRYQRYMQDYMGTIASVDEGVGCMLDYLDKNGLAENTIVVYTSDNGFYLGEHGWFDKRFMYEESLRIPLVIRYPKEIKPGTKSEALVQNLDFAPTFLDYAGIEIPKDMQGLSFRKLASCENAEWRDAIYYTYYEYPSIHMVKRHYGIRTNRYKLIHFYYDVDEWELYDLEADPKEMKNVYNDPTYSKVKESMQQKLIELRKKYGDSDETDSYYKNLYLKATKTNNKVSKH